MQLDSALVSRLAGLCRIGVDEAAATRMAVELSRILDYAEQLGEGDSRAGLPLTLQRRADEPRSFSAPERLVAASAGGSTGNNSRNIVRVPPVRGEAT